MTYNIKDIYFAGMRSVVARRISQIKDPKQRKIIAMRYGIRPYKKPMSLSEVGRAIGMGKTGVHWHEQRILDKIMRNAGSTKNK